jgi:hypothetical protein
MENAVFNPEVAMVSVARPGCGKLPDVFHYRPEQAVLLESARPLKAGGRALKLLAPRL